jgi:hypothetical protein
MAPQQPINAMINAAPPTAMKINAANIHKYKYQK